MGAEWPHPSPLPEEPADHRQRVLLGTFAVAISAALFIGPVARTGGAPPVPPDPSRPAPAFLLAPATLLMTFPALLVAAVATLVLPGIGHGRGQRGRQEGPGDSQQKKLVVFIVVPRWASVPSRTLR